MEFNSSNLYNSFCITNQSILAGGSFNYEFFSNIKFTINKCNNKTSKKPCRDIKEIESKIAGGYLEFYYVDRYIDAVDFEYPLKTFFNTYFILLDPNIRKSSDIYFKQINVSSDVGYIFQQFSNSSSIILDYFREQFDVFGAKLSDTILSFHINSSQNSVYISRYYMKLGDLTAMVGGIFQVCIVIGSMISNQFNKYKMNEKIMNTLYDFNVENEYFGELVVKKLKKNIYANEILRKQEFEDILNSEINPQIINKRNLEVEKNKKELTKKQNLILEGFIEDKAENNDNILRINDVRSKHNIISDKIEVLSFITGSKENNIGRKFKSEIKKNNLILDSNKILKSINLSNSQNPETIERLTEENETNRNYLDTNKNLIKKSREISFDSEKFQSESLNKRKGFSYKTQIKRASKSLKNRVFYIELMKKIEDYKRTMLGKLSISYCDIIGMILCRRCFKEYKKKYNLLSRTEEEMKKYIDYIEIVKLLQEFTKLKLILLSKNQQSLFSFISKPQIFYKDNTMKNSYLHGKLFEKNNISLQTLYEFYIETQEKGKRKSLIDERIVEHLDEDLKITFEIALKKTNQIANASE